VWEPGKLSETGYGVLVEAIHSGQTAEQRIYFMAEAYWGLEPKLLQLGFDFTYDKALYDRLRFSPREIFVATSWRRAVTSALRTLY